jgi:hypothetical protein
MASFTLGYVRAYDGYRISGGSDYDDTREYRTGGDQLDAFVASVPLNYEGFNLTPYGVYARIGEEVMNSQYTGMFDTWTSFLGTIASESADEDLYDDNVDAFWVGLPFGIDMIDPLSITGQFVYGSVDGGSSALDREGYFFDVSVDYTAMDLFTPSLYFYYSSGEDDDIDDGSETMPTLRNDGYYYPPAGAALGFNSAYGFGDGDYSYAQYVPHGVWSLGFALKDIQFVDKLSHSFAIAYSQGTHDEDAFTEEVVALDKEDSRFTEMTTEDSSVEVTFYNYYQIYENLKAVLELDYAALDMDEDIWGEGPNGGDYKDDDIYRATFGLSYDF